MAQLVKNRPIWSLCLLSDDDHLRICWLNLRFRNFIKIYIFIAGATTFSIKTIGTRAKLRHTQHNIRLIQADSSLFCYSECNYVNCRYAKCRLVDLNYDEYYSAEYQASLCLAWLC
jgi:hypothetical protein